MDRFQKEVIDRLARIEEIQKATHEKLNTHIIESKEVREEVRKNTQFRKFMAWLYAGLTGLGVVVLKKIGVL